MKLYKMLKGLGVESIYCEKRFKEAYLITLKATNIPLTTFGKGLTKEEALNSAYGEMLERIITRNAFSEYYINRLYPDAKEGDEFLNEELRKFYQIENLSKTELIDNNSDSLNILSIPFLEKKSKTKLYFPISIIHNLYGSNGLSFHTSLLEAYYAAKTEIIERYVKFQVIHYALPLPKIDHPLNSENIQIYDATLGGRYPVMAATYIKGDDIIISFGCDLEREKAIKKAYLELLQRELKPEGKIVGDIEWVRDVLNYLNHITDLSGDVHENFLKKPYFNLAPWKFSSLDVFPGKKEYIRVYKYKNSYAFHIVIPSVSEFYPVKDLMFHNNNRYKFIRPYILQYQKFPKKEVFQKLNELLFYQEDIGKPIGVIFEPPLSLEEFKKIVRGDKPLPHFHPHYKELLKLSKTLNESVLNEI